MIAHKHDRLLRLAAEIKTNPWQTVAGLCLTLGVAKAQLYRDKRALEAVGFVFTYSRAQGRFLIEKDPYLPIYNLTLTETFALTMGYVSSRLLGTLSSPTTPLRRSRRSWPTPPGHSASYS